MVALRKRMFFKSMAIFVVLCFLALQGDFSLLAQEDYAQKLQTAKEAYINGDYQAAKDALDVMIPELDKIEGNELLKGQAYLLFGAVHEKLGFNELAIKYYCLAKEIDANIAMEGLNLEELKYFNAECPKADPQVEQFENGKKAYFEENYDLSKTIFEALVAELAQIEGKEVFKGETYLLMGATYEKLKYKDLAIKYYCKSKQILGVGKTVEGLELKTLKYYKKDCPAGYVGVVGAKKKGGGGIIGIILGLALLGGIIWYLFINKNSPLKKKDKEEEKKGTYTSITLSWKMTVKGGKFSGGSLNRRDLIYLNGKNILDKTNNFPDQCTTYVTTHTYDFTDAITGPGTYKVRHKIELNKSSNWCIRTDWSLSFTYTYSGGSDPGSPKVTFTAPDPGLNNNLDDTKDLIIEYPTTKTAAKTITATTSANSNQ